MNKMFQYFLRFMNRCNNPKSLYMSTSRIIRISIRTSVGTMKICKKLSRSDTCIFQKGCKVVKAKSLNNFKNRK